MTVIPLVAGTDPSPWSTYVIVGVVTFLLGIAIFLLAGGFSHPASGIVVASFLLSVALMLLGFATGVTGALLWYREQRGTPSL